jgi:hypothetical protein
MAYFSPLQVRRNRSSGQRPLPAYRSDHVAHRCGGWVLLFRRRRARHVALLGMTDLSATRVVGTDLAFGLAIAMVGTGVHMIGGHYAGPLLMRLAIGGIAGGVVGTSAAPKIPNRNLRLALSLWLTVIGVQFCYQAASK